jgi:LmbE family N-acetylglucosaminyl deacetylase
MTLRHQAAGVHRRLLELRARDITAEVATRSALVLAPHPDDETIGCGATIARKAAAGARVLVVVAADGGSAIRRDECRAACDRLGLDSTSVRFLGLPDGDLAEHHDELVAGVRAALAATAPEELYVPAAIDQHADHRALAAAVTALAGALAGVTVYEFPVWFWNRWAWVDGGSASRQAMQFTRRFGGHVVAVRPRTVRTGEFLAVKRAALECYPSQLGDPDGTGGPGLDREWLELFLGSTELFFELG